MMTFVMVSAVKDGTDSLSGHTRSFGYLSQSTAAAPAAAGPSTRLVSSTGRRVPFSNIISPCIIHVRFQRNALLTDRQMTAQAMGPGNPSGQDCPLVHS